MRTNLIFSILFIANQYLIGQLPSTNIVLMEAQYSKILQLSSPKFLTHFNKNGYNNQPAFIDKNKILITSNYQSAGLTDIYELNLSSNKLSRITATDESEYSPFPRKSKGTFTVIRQEISQNPSVPQVLWEYPMDRSSNGQRLISKYQNIGYQCWISKDKIAIFLVGEPHKLIIVNVSTGEETFISYNVGRCLKKDANGNLYYIVKLGAVWSIRKFDIARSMSEYVTESLPESEDFDILPNGQLISGKNGKLFTYDLISKDGWKEVADLEAYNVKGITRIATTEDKIALVVSY
jgi:hypothetical protein